MEKRKKKKKNENCICCLFTAITYKCRGVVLFPTSVYFAIYCYFPIPFMYHALFFGTFTFAMYVLCLPFFLIVHNQKQVLLIKWVIFFLSLKNIFLFNFLKMVIFTMLFRCWSTLWKSTLKSIALFRRCLTLLISTLKKTKLIWRCSTLYISMLTYKTLFQSSFDTARRRDVISP